MESKDKPKLFVVTYTKNANKEETPLHTEPVGYDEAMRIKTEAEKSGKHDLKAGFLAALRLTEDKVDRYLKKKAAQNGSNSPEVQTTPDKSSKGGKAPAVAE